MSGDGVARRPEPDGDVDPGTPTRDRIPSESARLRALRLLSPAEASDIAQQRGQLATRHQVAAERLRAMAQSAMEHFDSASAAAQTFLDEWATLRDSSRRTSGEQTRFAVLTSELLDAERRLGRQWDALSRMLREAAHHEASAHILWTGRYHD